MQFRLFSVIAIPIIFGVLFFPVRNSAAQPDLGKLTDLVKTIESSGKTLHSKRGIREEHAREDIVLDRGEEGEKNQQQPLSRLEKIYRKYYQDIGGIRAEEKDPFTDFLKKVNQQSFSQKKQRPQVDEQWQEGRYDEGDYLSTLKGLDQSQKLIGKEAAALQKKYIGSLLEEKIEKEIEKEFGKEAAKDITEDKQKEDSTSKDVAADDNEVLRQIGYDFFQIDNDIDVDTVPVENLAVPGDTYTIGPGDYLLVRAWGAGVEFEEECRVSKEGTISISKMGVIPVAGLKSGEVEKAVDAEAQKYIPGVNLRVTLDGLKTLEVYFSGNVEQPGLHVMPAFSTIATALIKAGGPTKDGSLRTIKLIRNNQVLSVLDAYDILLRGDRSADRYLQSGDLVFVPDIGETVAMAGLVKKPGIYELKNEKKWHVMLGLAGGLLPQANSDRVTLKRFADNQGYALKEIHFNASVSDGETFPLRDGDFLLAQPVVPLQKAVKVTGHVFDPRLVEYKPGLTLRDVFQTSEIVKPGAIMGDALVRRYNPLTGYYTTLHFSPRDVLSGNEDMTLAEYDEIIILSREDYGIRELVHIGGAVWKPGAYPFSPEMSLSSLVSMAGGLKKSAMLASVEMNRQEIRENRVATNRQNLDWQTLRDEGKDIVLQEGDYVLIKEVKDYGQVTTVTLEGELLFPGIYVVREGDRLSGLLRRAGGYTENAYLYGAIFTREAARDLKRKNYVKLVEDLELEMGRAATKYAKLEGGEAETVLAAQASFLKGLKAKEKDIHGRVIINLASLPTLEQSKYNFVLEDGDVITVPRKPDFVSVLGSVYASNTYFYDSDFTVTDYLKKAGGPTRGADKKRMYVIQANGNVVSKRNGNGSYLFSSFNQMKLMPGDSLVVPEDLERVPWFKMLRDVSDLAFKIATTYGVVLSIHDHE